MSIPFKNHANCPWHLTETWGQRNLNIRLLEKVSIELATAKTCDIAHEGME